MKDDNTIGNKIKELRTQKGLTQKQLADDCGIADSAVRKYESGKVTPKIEMLRRLSNALGYNLIQYLSEQESSNLVNEAFSPNKDICVLDALLSTVSFRRADNVIDMNGAISLLDVEENEHQVDATALFKLIYHTEDDFHKAFKDLLYKTNNKIDGDKEN